MLSNETTYTIKISCTLVMYDNNHKKKIYIFVIYLDVFNLIFYDLYLLFALLPFLAMKVLPLEIVL